MVFAVPADNIYVIVGLLNTLQTDDDLAFILGHSENDHRLRATTCNWCLWSLHWWVVDTLPVSSWL